MKPAVLIVIPSEECRARAEDRAAGLTSLGFESHVCIGVDAMQQTLQSLQSQGQSTSTLVVLDGDLRANCAHAQLIRTLYPDSWVVSLLDDLGEEAQITSLQSGVDFYCARYASATLLGSILYSLLRRMGGAHAYTDLGSIGGAASAGWRLAQQSWVLEGPGGCALPLTTSERAFLLSLTQAPGMRASHEVLLRAIGAAGPEISLQAGYARLGVLVSRLRRKLLRKHGLQLPVKSLHRWGYMFTGELRP